MSFPSSSILHPALVHSALIPALLPPVAFELPQPVGGEEGQHGPYRELFFLWETDQHFCFDLSQFPCK